MNTIKHSIHPFEFLQSAKFANCSYPADITEVVKDELKDVHPSMFIGDDIFFMLFKIAYSYNTNRGNYRESYKVVFLNDFEGLSEYEASIMAETKFQSWLDTFNRQYPFRAISNVQILEIVPFANASLLVG